MTTTGGRCSSPWWRRCTRRPAYLLGPMTQILAWNRAASALFGSPDHLAPERRSLLWMLLVDPGKARDNPGREGTARNMVARFRSEYARHAGESDVRAVHRGVE